MLTCKHCGSTNVVAQAVEKQKKRGIIMSIIWILLAVCTFGIALLIPIFTRKGSKTKSVLVCQNCGKITKI